MTNDDYKRPLRFNELDPDNWDHQQLARAMKVQRSGALCPHGHRWLETGVLCVDGRVRCKLCVRALGTKWRRKARPLAKLAKGGE